MTAELSETSFAVLGLLDRRNASGYDLAALADRSLAFFWPVSRTMIYRELHRLAELGLLTSLDVPQSGVPDKRVYSITIEGRRRLDEWVSQPQLPRSEFRSGFLLKLMFSHRMPGGKLADLLEQYRRSLLDTVTRLTAILENMPDTPEANMGRMAAGHGLRTAQARLDWLAEEQARLVTD